MDKVKALYDFVSRDFRYVSLSFGLGRYQPHAASEVLANGYGDCKDKNTLLAALLAAQGFDSTSVLIGSQHKLDPDIPSPSQFDHVITRVNVDGQEIWLDSTNGVAPFRMLAFPLRDKQALAVAPDGGSALVRTPAEPAVCELRPQPDRRLVERHRQAHGALQRRRPAAIPNSVCASRCARFPTTSGRTCST